MSDKNFKIYDLRVNQIAEALGLDVEKPVFSWKLKSEKQNTMQTKVQILVGKTAGGADVWDSGEMSTDNSTGITFDGDVLQPETRYYVTVRVWNQDGEEAEASSWFETGLMNGSISAWDGAKWIGAPEYMVASNKLGVFVIESTFRIKEGTKAGIVFGANDARLMDISKNELQVEGENNIRFVLNIAKSPAVIEVYRRGYCKEDVADTPLYELGTKDLKTDRELITEENKHDFHKLTIEVEGNGAYTYLDDCRIDESSRETPSGDIVKMPRQLNPLGAFDVTTFPRLCEMGYYVGADSEAEYQGIRVRNLRKPCAEILAVDTENGKTLKGECLEISDPSRFSLPMLRTNFTVNGKVASARLYATARGIYECSMNGELVTAEYFAPGASQYDSHLMYQTYDVTDLVQEGWNGLGCVLASGWWSDSFSFRLYNYNYWGDRPSFLGRLVITYEDGHKETIVTDDNTWQYFGEGPYRYAGFFNGETYDARLEENYFNFSKSDFKVDGLKKPEVITPVVMEEQEGIFPGAACWPAMNEKEPELVGSYQAPVHEVETFTAKSMTEPLPGTYIYDLEQEIAGVPVLKFKGKPDRRSQSATEKYSIRICRNIKVWLGRCCRRTCVRLPMKILITVKAEV